MVNSYVLFSSFPGNPNVSRMEYTKLLARELLETHLANRIMNIHLPHELRLTISRIMKKPTPQEVTQDLKKQVRCRKCPSSLDRKTKKCATTASCQYVEVVSCLFAEDVSLNLPE